MPRLIKSRLHAKISKYKNEKNICNWDTKRSSPPRPSWFKSSKMRWMPLKRSLRVTSMRDWSSVKPSTINFSRDIKMWKKRLRTSRILKGSSLRRLMEAVNCLISMSRVWRDKEVWCKVVECLNLLVKEAEWEGLVTLLQNHHICEWFSKSISWTYFLLLATWFYLRTSLFGVSNS